MKQIILLVTVHLNIRLPLALLQPEPAAAPTGPEPEAHACQCCGNCGGCGSASMKKASLNPFPSWTTASTAERGGWYMSAATMTAATVSRWTMGRNVSASSPFPTPCCAGGSGRRCCRWTGNWKRPCSTAWTPSGAPSSLRPHFIAKSFRTLTKKPGTAKAIPDYFGSGKRAWSRLPAGVLLPSGESPAPTEAGAETGAAERHRWPALLGTRFWSGCGNSA